MSSLVLTYLLEMVLPSAEDYLAAERQLTAAYRGRPDDCTQEVNLVRRRAGELAVAIDGLRDRGQEEFGIKASKFPGLIDPLCVIPGTDAERPCIDRVRAVAVAWRHNRADDKTLCITRFDDVSTKGAGLGIDGFGLGKFGGGPEAVAVLKDGQVRKLLGDFPTAIHGWLRFLAAQGVGLPPGPLMVCGFDVSVSPVPEA